MACKSEPGELSPSVSTGFTAALHSLSCQALKVEKRFTRRFVEFEEAAVVIQSDMLEIFIRDIFSMKKLGGFQNRTLVESYDIYPLACMNFLSLLGPLATNVTKVPATTSVPNLNQVHDFSCIKLPNAETL